MKQLQKKIIWIFALCILSAYAYTQPKEEDIIKQQLFERLFGDKALFDAQMVQKVLADQHGKRHYIDRNGDGKPEEVWFIDTDPRHHAKMQPLLVRVFDEDNDLEVGKEPDLDSDLYIADWQANGIVDAVVDYRDVDEDQDLDEMEIFYYDKLKTTGEGCVRIWWARDDGDDNLLWYTVDYRYYQRPCQFYSHFGGDETFNYLYLTQTADTIMPIFENPFLFYDHDKDGVTEDVIRIEAVGDTLHYLRWSFDADNDASPGRTRDFDVTVVACAPGWTVEKKRESDFTRHISKNDGDILNIRGLPTTPILKREIAPDYLNNITWARVQLTWDENDLNIAANKIDTLERWFERWEGIIAPANEEPGFYFPQIGGPVCSAFNKRTEIVLSPKGPNQFYFSPADHRIHMKYSDRAFIRVDYNNDLIADMYYNWYDANRDGLLDKITIDVDGDSIPDDSYNLDTSSVKPLKWNFREINEVFSQLVTNEPESLYLLDNALYTALEYVEKGAGLDPVWNMIQDGMRGANIPGYMTASLVNSNESMIYYLRLVSDRQIVKLRKLGAGNKTFWKKFQEARSKGETKAMADVLCKEFRLKTSVLDYKNWIANLRKKPEYPRVAWDNKWYPPNWVWESENAAYRLYDGHLDMFGKHKKELILPQFTRGVSYHKEQSWGMDVLHVDQSSGCGGLTLYVNDVAYPVRNDNNTGTPTFTGRLVEQTPDKVTIEILAEGVGPAQIPYTVKWRPTVLAGRADSQMEVVVEGGNPDDKVELGVGIVRMGDETFFNNREAGIMGSWGFQDTAIGWIGLGLVYPESQFIRIDELPEEHRVLLLCKPGKPMTYHIQGDWLRGHQFPCCPSAKDWENTLKKTAKMVGLNQ